MRSVAAFRGAAGSLRSEIGREEQRFSRQGIGRLYIALIERGAGGFDEPSDRDEGIVLCRGEAGRIDSTQDFIGS